MSKKTIILAAVILVIVLIAAAVGYRSLSERQKREQAAAAETSEVSAVPYDGNVSDTPAVQETSESPETPGEELPPAADFTAEDLKGNEVSLSGFAGKPVIINFWASWCPPCKAELPYFQEAYNNYGDQIVFMMVDLLDGGRETRATLDAFLLTTGFTFPVYADTSGSAADAYSLYSIPVTVAVDAEGRLVSQRTGSLSEEDLDSIISSLLE